jgi:hypothetical protein
MGTATATSAGFFMCRLWQRIEQLTLILHADITSFFYKNDHEWMLMFLGHRIAGRRLRGLI